VAHGNGVVGGLRVHPGEQVAHGDLICIIETRSATT